MNQLHSWPFPTSSPLPPPEPPPSQSTKPAGPLCQSLARDHKAASENRHQMSPWCQSLLDSALVEKPFSAEDISQWPKSSKAAGHQSVALSLTARPTLAAFLGAAIVSDLGAPTRLFQLLFTVPLRAWGKQWEGPSPSTLPNPSLCH